MLSTCCIFCYRSDDRSVDSLTGSQSSLLIMEPPPWQTKRRRASTFHEGESRDETPSPRWRRRGASFHEARLLSSQTVSEETTNQPGAPAESSSYPLPPPCTCPYFGEKSQKTPLPAPAELKIVPSDSLQVSSVKLGLDVERTVSPSISPIKSSLARSRRCSGGSSPNNVMVTWEPRRSHRRGNQTHTFK